MQTTLSYWVLALVLCGFTARALDGEFYRQFLTLVDTNQVLLRRITSPVLVDTNNTGIKITNAVLNLNSLKQAGEISGMRLGISMDEVIGRWGKPTGGCSPGFIHPGLTTFFYSDIALGFEGDRLETVRIRPNFKFADGLSVTSKVDEFVRALGAPTSRRDAGRNRNLIYGSPNATLRMDFRDDELMNIWLERSAKRAEPWK